MAEPLNTGLSAQQVLTAFDRALNDYTDAEIDALLSEKQDTISDLASIRSGAAAGATAVQQTAFETDQQRQETEIGAVANAGAKNLFDIQHPSVVRDTEYNVTSDGGVELTCSNAAWTQYIISDISVESGREYDFTLYVDAISGTDKFRAYVREDNYSGNMLYDSGNISTSETITSKIASSSGKIWVGVYLNNSATAKTASAKIRAMLCPASITDNTFVPYAKTNRELTVAEDEDRAALVEQVDEGAKNLFRITASSQVVGGVTFTVNADGTIIANGTKTNNDWLYLSTGNSLAAGTYVLSSGLTPQSDMNLRLLIATADSLGSAIMSAEGTRQAHIKQLTSDYTGLYYAIRISSGTTVNNVVFKPMICTAADYKISPAFVPYRPSWQEMYDMIKALQSGS